MNEIELWKRSLLKLPDDSFDIVRNYLGGLKPFNKHSIIEDLVSFLNRTETRKRIADCINEDDSRVITE